MATHDPTDDRAAAKRLTVDHHDPEPIYRQLAAIIRGQIVRVELQPRDPIPSEKQLQQEHGVARETVRHAIALLREEGYVYTLPQRGSFVAERDSATS
ncbi:MAG TPA: winged helix-turn-helix domain-containing protein [Jiangellaceae bacterium]